MTASSQRALPKKAALLQRGCQRAGKLGVRGAAGGIKMQNLRGESGSQRIDIFRGQHKKQGRRIKSEGRIGGVLRDQTHEGGKRSFL